MFHKVFAHYIHTYHSNFVPEGVAEASQILRDSPHVLPKLLRYEESADSAGGKPIAHTINPLVAFYDIHERNVLFFYSVPGTTRHFAY
jgi:hypothetical protein